MLFEISSNSYVPQYAQVSTYYLFRKRNLMIQFQRCSGFCKPSRLDPCSNGGFLLLYIREDIPSRLLTEYKPPENLECLFVEINITKKKWLLCCSYNPHKHNISNHLHHLNKGLDVYLKHYDNLLILGDLNSELKDSCLNDFSNVNNLKSLNKEPTCFKNPNNPSCIDLFLTNRSIYFQNTSTIETGISDCHKLVVTMLKMFYENKAEYHSILKL